MHHTASDRVAAWMFDAALPFWATSGLDMLHGGPFESLSLSGDSTGQPDFKRLRVTARQIYVFSHAEILGSRDARAAADHCYAFLRHVWATGHESWPRTLTRSGAVLDPTPDLYDYAFVLYALGWRARATGHAEPLDLAHRTLDLVERQFAHPSGLGFHHVLPHLLPRHQNPHMHLTEAALALFETSGEARFGALADRMAELFASRIFGPGRHVLAEFFDEGWTPIPGAQGRVAEPGHMFEWAWILNQHRRLRGGDHAGTIARLVNWAEAYGVDPATGVTFNGVRDDGVVLDRGSRTWPNTERIKAWIAHADANGVDARGPVNASLDLLFSRYLDPAPRGCWFDAYDGVGRMSATTIPTSTLYHLFLAFAEAIRAASAQLRD